MGCQGIEALTRFERHQRGCLSIMRYCVLKKEGAIAKQQEAQAG